MRLFLSSEGFGNNAAALVKLVGKNKKVAFIDNAKDYLNDEDRLQHVNEKRADFEELGFIFEEIDLRKYFGKRNGLEEKMAGFGLVWLAGGNTFILRRALAYSGFDQIITMLVKENKLVYGGSSAGSIIPTPSLRGTELGDNTNEVPEGYKPQVIWEGLNLVPFYVVPHYGSDWFGQESADMKSYLEDNKLKHYAIEDGQAIMVNHNNVELLK